MRLIVIGVNYNAPLNLREQINAGASNPHGILKEVVELPGVTGVVLLSTCNRTELYLEARSELPIYAWFTKKIENSLELEPYYYSHVGLEAVKHLMRVASGLESMVLGEVEILGQLKRAFHLAEQSGYTNKNLRRVFQATFAVAKKVRTSTQVNDNPISIAYLAVKLATRIFARLEKQSALLVGAGENTACIAKNLLAQGVKKFFFANRTRKNAEILVNELGIHSQAEILHIDQLLDYLPKSDIVISSTSAESTLIGKSQVELAIRSRKYKPMFMIDLAVPRDIESQVKEIPDVYLYCIDDLKGMADENRKVRHQAAIHAEDIIAIEAGKFMSWLESQDLMDAVHIFRHKMYQERDKLVIQALNQLKSGKDPEYVIERLGYQLLNKLLHDPTIILREAAINRELEILEKIKEK